MKIGKMIVPVLCVGVVSLTAFADDNGAFEAHLVGSSVGQHVAGLFHGVQSLLQLLPAETHSVSRTAAGHAIRSTAPAAVVETIRTSRNTVLFFMAK